MNAVALLTIVVPVYNRAGQVAMTLDTIAASTCPLFDLIVVDNASTDNSLDVCRQWAAMHSGKGFDVRVESEEKAGAPAARNKGLSLCRTPYIYYFDSDDLFSAEFVADISRHLTACTTRPDMLFVPSQQQLKGKLRIRAYSTCASPRLHILNAMLGTQNMVFKTAWLRELGGWDEALTIWQDWELGLRALQARPAMHWLTTRSYHSILIHPDSITGSSMSRRVDGIAGALHKALADCQSNQAPDQGSRYALYLRTHIIMGKIRHETGKCRPAVLEVFARQCLPDATWRQRTAGRMLELYSALGLPGAWRIAVSCC